LDARKIAKNCITTYLDMDIRCATLWSTYQLECTVWRRTVFWEASCMVCCSTAQIWSSTGVFLHAVCWKSSIPLQHWPGCQNRSTSGNVRSGSSSLSENW